MFSNGKKLDDSSWSLRQRLTQSEDFPHDDAERPDVTFRNVVFALKRLLSSPSNEVRLLPGLTVFGDAEAADLWHVVHHENVSGAKFAVTSCPSPVRAGLMKSVTPRVSFPKQSRLR